MWHVTRKALIPHIWRLLAACQAKRCKLQKLHCIAEIRAHWVETKPFEIDNPRHHYQIAWQCRLCLYSCGGKVFWRFLGSLWVDKSRVLASGWMDENSTVRGIMKRSVSNRMGYRYVRTSMSQSTLRCKRGWNESQPCTYFARTRLITRTLCPRISPLWTSVTRHLSNRLAWLKENIAAPSIMYRFLPVGYKKDCFLRETIASWSWNNWNMTHVEMEISLSILEFSEDRPNGPGQSRESF